MEYGWVGTSEAGSKFDPAISHSPQIAATHGVALRAASPLLPTATHILNLQIKHIVYSLSFPDNFTTEEQLFLFTVLFIVLGIFFYSKP